MYPNPTTGRIVEKSGGVIYEKMRMQLVSMNGEYPGVRAGRGLPTHDHQRAGQANEHRLVTPITKNGCHMATVFFITGRIVYKPRWNFNSAAACKTSERVSGIWAIPLSMPQS